MVTDDNGRINITPKDIDNMSHQQRQEARAELAAMVSDIEHQLSEHPKLGTDGEPLPLEEYRKWRRSARRMLQVAKRVLHLVSQKCKSGNASEHEFKVVRNHILAGLIARGAGANCASTANQMAHDVLKAWGIHDA